MLEFFHFKKAIPFMRYGKTTTAISLATFLFSVWALFFYGLNLGVDFTGGTVMEVRYAQAAVMKPPSGGFILSGTQQTPDCWCNLCR